jgi:Uma2 family endonuclease
MAPTIYDQFLSEADYLKVEESAREKSEYVAGRLFAMSGATVAHNLIIMNLVGSLLPVAKQSGCKVFASDVKLKIESLRSFYYPDLIVTCEAVNSSAVFVTAPCLIIEVLSPSTMSIDRREKLLAYRSIASLQEYVLVHQKQRRIEINRKDKNSNWRLFEFENSDSALIACLATGEVHIKLDSAPRAAVQKQWRRSRLVDPNRISFDTLQPSSHFRQGFSKQPLEAAAISVYIFGNARTSAYPEESPRERWVLAMDAFLESHSARLLRPLAKLRLLHLSRSTFARRLSSPGCPRQALRFSALLAHFHPGLHHLRTSSS